MKLLIVTPAPPGTVRGNRITALRWARMLRDLGHQVRVTEAYHGQSCDALIALHAKRSADSIDRFRDRCPTSPVILALTGTDLYRDLGNSAAAQRSLTLSDRFVVLQPLAIESLPQDQQHKARVIYQSVIPPSRLPKRRTDRFDVAVVGHLRAVKDPMRTAMAVRRLPADSRVSVVHVGESLSDDFASRATQESQQNDRYEWIGQKSRPQTIRLIAGSRLLVVTSKMEGGANVVGEAIAVGTPVISTNIPGSTGLLGADYPGLFDYGNTRQLRELLLRAEQDSEFYAQLVDQCARRRHLFDPATEQQSWRVLLEELGFRS